MPNGVFLIAWLASMDAKWLFYNWKVLFDVTDVLERHVGRYQIMRHVLPMFYKLVDQENVKSEIETGGCVSTEALRCFTKALRS